VKNGNIHINSHGSRALNVTGSAIINTESPITIVGGYRIVGSVVINPTPMTGASVLPDPLASLPVPNLASYPVRHGTASHPDTLRITGSGSVTLDPGVYYGGIAITGSNNVTLNPGVYIMAGSGFKITGSSRVTGSHIFMYITEDPSHTSGDGKMGKLKLTGSQQLTLTAPDSGDYAGILYFQDRSNDEDVDITGSSMLSGSTGVIYIPAGRLNVTGSADVHLNFVVNKIRFTGSTILTVEGYQGPGWTAVTSALTE